MKNLKTNLILGCGYLGRRVAALWCERRESVCVVTRDSQRASDFERQGLQAVVADVTAPATLAALPVADVVLMAVGFDRSAGHTIEQVYVDGLRNVLDALPVETGRIVYVSSTGVYGQDDGSWVDEDSPCEPIREAGRACLAAEQLLAAHPRGRQATVLRLAGIYGPDRVPRSREVLAGAPLAVAGGGVMNLIHVDDAAACVVAAGTRVGEFRVYTVSDGVPVSRHEYFEQYARLIGAPEPVFVLADEQSPKMQRAATNKRVRNTRMLNELAVKLAFPDYRRGLQAIVADSENA